MFKNLAGAFYQLIKHSILKRRRLVDIKSLNVMYYRPFDRSMDLRIINEFSKYGHITLHFFAYTEEVTTEQDLTGLSYGLVV